MESREVQAFDDPALKVALRRCCGGICAPQELRQKIAQCLTAVEDSQPAGGPVLATASVEPVIAPQFRRDTKARMFLFGGNTVIGLAVAAMLLVVVGIAALRLGQMSPEPVPPALSLAMLTRHDLCCGAPNHHDPSLPNASIASLGGILENQLGHSVLAADLASDGWTFRGAARCPVGSMISAHFLYSKADQTISVFSLPAAAYPGIESKRRYEASVQNHLIVCYARDGAVIGYVGYGASGDLKMPELESIITKHQSDATVAIAPRNGAMLAQLIHEER